MAVTDTANAWFCEAPDCGGFASWREKQFTVREIRCGGGIYISLITRSIPETGWATWFEFELIR